MAIKRAKFRRQSIEGGGQDSISVKMNDRKRRLLSRSMQQLNQSKPSTALWQLAEIGAKVIQWPIIAALVDIILNNKRKNKRTGESVKFED